MEVKPDVVVMSSKGQVVVPRDIRDAVNADAGTEFIVYGANDSIILKKIRMPNFSAKQLEKLVSENEKRLKKAGYKDEKSVKQLITEAIQETRKSR